MFMARKEVLAHSERQVSKNTPNTQDLKVVVDGGLSDELPDFMVSAEKTSSLDVANTR